MLPDDPRHGTNAGYLAHQNEHERACRPCADARYHARKRILAAKVRGERLLYDAGEVRAVVQPWLDMGISPSAISIAAGFKSQRGGTLSQLLRHGGTVRRATYRAYLGVTEDAISPDAKVYADLTRYRVRSLMAIGHPLADMPINTTGQWRKRAHVNVATARAVRDYYAAHEFKIGPSANTMSRARNAGYPPPLAWDDPGTLAWPGGIRVEAHGVRGREPKRTYVDPIVVAELLAGRTVDSTRQEKEAAMARWLAWGRSERSLCEMHGWHSGRYVPRESVAS